MSLNSWSQELLEIKKLKELIYIENSILVKEMDSLANAQDEVVALLYSRRVLEVIITEICADKLGRDRGNEPLLSIIDRLVKDKVIPEFIHSAMHNLNRNATYGAHPKDFDPRQVRTAIIDLLTILDWYFKEKNYKKVSDVIEKTEKQEVKPIEITKPIKEKIIKDEKPKAPVQVKNAESKQPAQNRSNTLTIILASAIIIIAIIILVIVFMKNSVPSSKPVVAEKDTLNEKNAKTNISKLKTTVADSVPKPIVKEIIVKKEAVPQKKEPATIGKPIAKLENQNKINTQEPTIVLNQQEYAEEDADKLFQKLTDSNLPYSERKNISQRLLAQFEKNARINIIIEGLASDNVGYEDYVNKLLLLKNREIIILKQERGGTGKIKLLEVNEKRK